MGPSLAAAACAAEAARPLPSTIGETGGDDAGVSPVGSGVSLDGAASSMADAPATFEAETPEGETSPDSAEPMATSTDCSSLPLCDGFEQDAAGAMPMGWNVVMGCNASQMPDGPAVGGGLIVGVDSSQHHSGSHSLRVVDGDSADTTR
jgi:hypothetical protein